MPNLWVIYGPELEHRLLPRVDICSTVCFQEPHLGSPGLDLATLLSMPLQVVLRWGCL